MRKRKGKPGPGGARFLLSVAMCVAAACAVAQDRGRADWPMIGGSAGNTHFSALRQIDRGNVGKLKEVWRFDTGEAGGLETTPVVVEGVLYALTPKQRVIALDAATGKLLWRFDSGVVGTQPDRGVAFWAEGKERRLLVGIMNFVYALDPATGRPVAGFGRDGRIDLREGLGREAAIQSIVLTSPGVLYRDLLIVGGRTPETLPAPPGDVRAYDVRTGRLRWSFHTIPRPGEFGYETWPREAWKTAGAANNWAGMAVDVERGIVFVPTGSAAPDFYGGARQGDDLFANTLLALDATTGRRLWHFQGVHHDLWDRDFPSAPLLFMARREGKEIPAIAQTTKQGFLYLFDRVTGRPLFPIEERAASGSTTPGESAAATQPYPTRPEPFALQTVTEANLTTRTPAAHDWAVERLREMRNDGQFVPLSVGRDTLVAPSFEGGGEWGGVAVDPVRHVLFVNANNYASMGALAAPGVAASPGQQTYAAQCSLCHGEHRAGSPPEFPSLLGVGSRLTSTQIEAVLHEGRGRMPAFPALQGKGLADLLHYLRTSADDPGGEMGAGAAGGGYTMTGYRRFNDPDGYPATAAPWGTLNALDLDTGRYLWRVPLGQYPELVAQGMADTGSENYGGPIVTAGGVLFIAATNFDHKLRAFDTATGKVLWQAVLPFAGNATPATYEAGGRQFVVIAAGGSTMNPRGPLGGVYVAYALRR